MESNLIITILIKVLGNYWYIFLLYMAFNFLDWITGSLRAIKSKTVSSYIGIKGLLKKLGNWIVIGLAFSFSSLFVIIGKKIININLTIMYSLGWFTFSLLIINEIISIVENLVALNIKVPNIFIKSLKTTHSVLNNISNKIIDKNNDEYNSKS